jgi:hypothetical protein
MRVGNIATSTEEHVGFCKRRGVNFRAADAPALHADDSVEVVVARTEAQRAKAWELVSRRYAWRGYHCSPMAPFPDAGRALHYTTLLAQSGGKPLGTVTLGVDSAAGLLVDEVNRCEVDAVRAQRRGAAELVRLAIEDGVASSRVWRVLLESLNLLCRRIHDVSDLFIEVNPRHVDFYRRAFGFRVIAPVRSCPRVGAPSVLLRLAREELDAKLHGAATSQDMENADHEHLARLAA